MFRAMFRWLFGWAYGPELERMRGEMWAESKTIIKVATAEVIKLVAIQYDAVAAHQLDVASVKLKAMLSEIIGNAATASRQAAAKTIEDKLAALQAIDVCFQETGKLILICRVNGQDYVKIINIPEEFRFDELKKMIAEIQRIYGAQPLYVDSPFRWLNDELKKH